MAVEAELVRSSPGLVQDEKVVTGQRQGAAWFVSGLSLTAAGPIDIAGCKACVFSSQLDVDGREFHRLARPFQGGGAAELLVFFFRRAAADLQGSPDRPRRNAVDANALGA